MNTGYRQLIYSGIGVGMIGLAVLTAACSSPASTASSPSPSAIQSSTPVAPATTPAATVQPSAGARQPFAQGAVGTIASISANSVMLNTLQGGQLTVNVAQNTTIQMDVKGTISDLQVGQFLTVAGNTDSSGNVAATSIMLRAQSPGTARTPPAGTNFPTGVRPGRTDGGAGSGFPARGTFGTVASINGNTLVLNAGQGQVTVTVDANTLIQKTVAGTIADLKVGDSITAMGPRDASGNVNAVAITVRSQELGAPAP
jgi:Domain of unknown function (DUF5666)